jgi:methylmalonyl-CoA/ethylmalonyl-CoA epimerase
LTGLVEFRYNGKLQKGWSAVSIVKRFDRISFAVGDLDKARAFFEQALGAEFGDVEDVAEFKFKSQPFTLGGQTLQLVSPYETTSAISHFLMKRGPGFHHVTFEVADLDEVVAGLEAKGIAVASRHDYAEPREGLRMREAFVHPEDTPDLLVQLVEKKKR